MQKLYKFFNLYKSFYLSKNETNLNTFVLDSNTKNLFPNNLFLEADKYIRVDYRTEGGIF